MGYPLQQSQTAQPLVFLLVASSDHLTGATGKTPTVTLSKNGGSFASPSGAVTEIGNGWYKVAGNATDANTLGPLLLHATATGCDDSDDRFDVVAYNPQDSVRLGLTALPNAAAGATGGLDCTIAQGGTAQAGAAGSITLAAGASATDDLYKGAWVQITSGTGAGQTRVISGYVGATKVASVSRNWTTTPDNTSVYQVKGNSSAALDASLQVTAASVQGNVTGSVGSVTGAVGSVTGAVGSVTGNVGGNVAGSTGSVTGNVGGNVVGSVGSVTGNVGGNVAGSVGSVTGAVGSVTGNVGGNVVGSAGSVTGNVGGNVVGSVGSVVAAVTVGTNNDKTGYSLTTLESLVAHSGTAQAGGATSITLTAGASSTTDFYKGALVKVYGGTGAGQVRTVTAYNGSTKVATVDRAWATNPDNTSTYGVLFVEMAALDSSLQVAASAVNGNVTGSVGSVTGNVGGSVGSVTGNVGGNVTGSVGSVASGGITRASFSADSGHQTVRSNTAQAGAAGTITLDASASATDSFYKGLWIFLTGGTGVGQVRLCTGYTGASKVAAVTPNWTTAPDNTSTFALLPAGGVDVELWGAAAPNALVSGRVDATVGAMQTDTLTAGALATSAVTEIADGFLDRDMSAGTDSNARSPRNALRFLRNKWSLSGTTLTVTKEDDSTTAWTATVTATPGADPITANDPA